MGSVTVLLTQLSIKRWPVSFPEDEKVVVQPAPGEKRVDNADSGEPAARKDPAKTGQPGPGPDDSLDENTKDSGQEKDAGTPTKGPGAKTPAGTPTKGPGAKTPAGTPTKGPGATTPAKGAGVMDSPRYLRSPREKSQERSSSPFRRNVVEPLPGTGSAAAASQGSLVSLRSEASSASKGEFPL